MRDTLPRIRFFGALSVFWLRVVSVSFLAMALLTGHPGSTAPLIKSPQAAPLTQRVQIGPGGVIDPKRHCQTVRECRFTRGGIFRGCISAYSCRACQFVPAPCTISGREQICQRMRCHWGA
jgi:hypothetical protein